MELTPLTKLGNVKTITVIIVIIAFLSIILCIVLFESSSNASLPTPSSAIPTTAHYGAKIGDSGSNLVGFDLTIYSPTNKEYANTVPLNFSINWIYGLMFSDNATQYGEYAYQIDKNPPISLESNQKSNSANNFISNPSFLTNIDISKLSNGQHRFVIIATMKWNPFGYEPVSVYHETSDSVMFLVKN